MKDISLRVYNTVKNIGEIKFTTDDGKPTIIKAQKGVNYELFDHSVDRAPNHVVSKRHGKDLHVSFTRNAKDTDLIIEDFYNNGEQALIGVAEDGQYYYYLPDTAEVQDYVTQLEDTDIQGQALGGEHLVAPLWVDLPMAGFPWWLGVGLLPLLFINKGDDDKETVDEKPTDEKPIDKEPTDEKPKEIDDKLKAKPDTDTATEDSKEVATGNVITGVNTTNSKDGKDLINDQDVKVTGVRKGTASENYDIVENLGTEVKGNYGSLTLNEDGSYKYIVANDDLVVDKLKDGEERIDTFSYTIKDKNGKLSTTTLTISVEGKNDAPVAKPNERDLPENVATAKGNVILDKGVKGELDFDVETPNDELTLTEFVVNGKTYKPNDTATIVENGKEIGIITINDKGEYNFIRQNGFEGDVPKVSYTISDNDGKTASSTLDIHIAKSDKPTENKPNDINKPTEQVFAKVSIKGPDSVEESAGKAEYTLKLDKVSTEDVTITVKTLLGRATDVAPVKGNQNVDSEDLTADSQTVTIPAGKTTATISIPIKEDTKAESPEDYTVYIANVKGGTIAKDVAEKLVVTTINDNDSKPVIGEARDISPTTDYQIDDIGDVELDFSKLSNIAKIDMNNGTKQNLNLSANDVLNITDNNNQLFIDGDNADTINLTGFSKQDNSDKADYDLYLADNNIALYLDTDVGLII